MAAAASNNNNSSKPAVPIIHSLSNGLDPDTTFVQADPETFRAVVQRLTGAATATATSKQRTVMTDEEDRAIAEKGFYLHPTPFSGSHPPELLPLFPLHSPY